MGRWNLGALGQIAYIAITVVSTVSLVKSLVTGATKLLAGGLRAALRRAMGATRAALPAIRAALSKGVAAVRGGLGRLRAGLTSLLRSGGQLSRKSFKEWLGFGGPRGLNGVLGETSNYVRLPGWWPRYTSNIAMHVPQGTWAYRETWFHERFHQWLARHVGINVAAWSTKIKGFPVFGAVAYVEEVFAYAFGSAAAGRIWGVAAAPLSAFGSLTGGEFVATLLTGALTVGGWLGYKRATSGSPGPRPPTGDRP
jgi:hypothetical protein